MIITIAWWNLDDSPQTIHSLRQYLKNEGIMPWKSIKGLRLKMWLSDSKKNLWGAIMLWESSQYMAQDLPPNIATSLIGYPPTLRKQFEIEASVEGNFFHETLSSLGLVYEKF